MSAPTRLFTIFGTKDGKPYEKKIRTYGLSAALKYAKKEGVTVREVSDYSGVLWRAK